MEEPEFVTHFLKYYAEVKLIRPFPNNDKKEENYFLSIPYFPNNAPPNLKFLNSIICINDIGYNSIIINENIINGGI